MLKEFISNAALLIASFSLMGVLFKDKPLYPTSPLSTKLYWGTCFGILGNVLMSFSFQVGPDIYADLRHLAIVIAGAFGGYIPAIIAAALISIGRICLFGFNHSALLPAVAALLTGVVCGVISKLNIHRTAKAFTMNLCGLLIISIVFIIRIEDAAVLKNVLSLHCLISLVGGVFGYHFFVFVVDSNETQHQLKHSLFKVKETEERFRLLAEYSSDMITMHNDQAEYIYISPAVKEVIHFEYPELLGKTLETFIHPDDVERTNSMFQRALQKGSAESTHRYRSKFGDYIWIESTLKSVPYQEEGEKKVIIVSRNITNRKLTEQKLQEANELLNRLSYMDGLTGIANRRYFDETLLREWAKAINLHTPITLVMFDIDYFKKYNDTYGHLKGDFCLQKIAQAINDLFPEPSNCTFCRYGGEEFALILPSSNGENGLEIAQQIKETVQSLKVPHKSSEIADIITLSIGIASMYPTKLNHPDLLIKAADSSLYLSKTRGRNTISINELSWKDSK
ncbi:diguanylate cyclase [Bacillus sp. ISL-18]|uniref:diguanylate cyclase domain-containing protein n=1 Tax=Bacillus sp. ISL-18 TaxID=2819118 RepID=UPI001BE55FF0|nr:diguanylate cyclase [Bacillus sp. ISL-18]MBT2653680.1 diguanylate cyclase [Bacillus sp. ISL-18]